MSKPNIVFIITDQQRFDTIRAMGHPHMITPVLDRLVAEGTAFETMCVTSPSCAPSRASLFSGLYPHASGVLRNDEPWNYSWVGELAGAGYRCVNIGKMHTSPFEKSFGFHERHVTENKDRAHPNLPFYLDNWDKALHARGITKPSRVTYRAHPDYRERLGAFVWEPPADLHPDSFVGETACWWLDSYQGDEPFFLQVGLPGPHPPYDPTQPYLDRYADADLPAAIEDDSENQPRAYQALRADHIAQDHDAVVHLDKPTPEQIRRQRAHYCANVTMIDELVGQLVASLEQRGVLNDTVIIFTSDHGDSLNDHGHSQKWTMYESSIRVPCIVWAPGKVAGGHKVARPVSLMDLGPTILELAGVSPPAWMHARSLMPFLRGGDDPERTEVFAEHAADFILSQTEMVTMLRTQTHKLVHFVDSEEGQLFDLRADPDELNNLWSDPAHASRKAELLERMHRWRCESALRAQGFIRHLAAR